MNLLINTLKTINNIVFPKLCFHCSVKLTDSESILCSSCKQKLTFRKDNLCEKCGSTLINRRCNLCEEIKFHFNKAYSVFKFNKILKSLIHDFKYENYTIIADFLAEEAIEYLKFINFNEKIDYIIPIPLHNVKKRARGFNQAALISKKISEYFKLDNDFDIITRKRFTKTQTKLTRQQRIKNVKDIFLINKKDKIENKNIMIIDDVFTTGSTMNSLSGKLVSNGVNKIYALTIGRA